MYNFLQFTHGAADVDNLMFVGWLRYVQSIHEPEHCRNPDRFVGQIIPAKARWRARLLRKRTVANLRADPFYYYLIARTAYYDDIVRKSITENVRQIIIVGCGTDTRAYRFGESLSQRRVAVLECDQPSVIGIKRDNARRCWPSAHVDYMGIDLNAGRWPEFEIRLDRHAETKTLVLMEGVSPYVNELAFCDFLRLLRDKLGKESLVAYDFKTAGVNDQLGHSGDTVSPFRLSASREQVATFHEKLGFKLESMELSSELCERLLPHGTDSAVPAFSEDCLLSLTLL
jgi:methyltransferase (TIGR00027 family)